MSDSVSVHASPAQNVGLPRNLSGRLDFLQALSGLLLTLFILAHMVLVSSVIISPALMNGIAWMFEVTYMTQVGGPIILLLMIFHFIVAARKMPFRTGELTTFWEHARLVKHKDTWLWLVQVVTAIFILVMASAHIHTILSDLPISAAKSAGRMGWTTLVLFQIPVALHVGIGLYRVGVKYGYITSACREKMQRLTYYAIAAFIVIGLLTLLRFSLLNQVQAISIG